jgi:16S rRNA (uracil1498-N3)-methyltransferase
LAAERSIVLPAGRNKIERWERMAIESAKQSRRSGVMSISALTPLEKAIQSATHGWYLSTAGNAIPARAAMDRVLPEELTLFIGPEGGWTDGEIDRMNTAGFTGVSLTSTVLRIETAAVTAAAVVLCLTETRSPPNSDSTPPSSPGMPTSSPV